MLSARKQGELWKTRHNSGGVSVADSSLPSTERVNPAAPTLTNAALSAAGRDVGNLPAGPSASTRSACLGAMPPRSWAAAGPARWRGPSAGQEAPEGGRRATTPGGRGLKGRRRRNEGGANEVLPSSASPLRLRRPLRRSRRWRWRRNGQRGGANARRGTAPGRGGHVRARHQSPWVPGPPGPLGVGGLEGQVRQEGSRPASD